LNPDIGLLVREKLGLHRMGGVMQTVSRSSHRTVVVAAAVTAAAVVLPLAGAPAALAHPPGTTELVSVSTQGAAGDDDSRLATISADGRFVAFWSFASTLVPGDTNGAADVFVRDRLAGTTERVSVDSRGRQAIGAGIDTNFGRPAISANGRFVAFASSATNLVKGDRNQVADIFVRDRQTGKTERVSMVGRRTEANSDSSDPSISPDGRFVAFSSFADNLVPGDTNFTADVFLLDRSTGGLQRVSVSSAGAQANNTSGGPVVSPDGRLVAFTSGADNLVPGEPQDSASDVYLRDVVSGTTEGITTATTGIVRHSGGAAMSADGNLIAFHSWDNGVVVPDTNDRYDVYVLNRTTGVTERVSVDSAGVQGNNDSTGPSISSDGRFVAFTSDADNLVAGDGNFDIDVFVHDRVTHTTVRASVSTDGTETGFELGSLNASISANGQEVAFESEGALVPTDPGFPVDVYVHDEGAS
jgi:Tol biopolymer transport system component